MNEDITEDLKKMIYKIASKYSKYYSLEDLYQAGAIGVIKAKKKFKKHYNAKFTTYAYNYILGEMLDYIRKEKSIKVSSDYLKIYKRYGQIKEVLTQKFSRIPNNTEIAMVMNINENLLNDVILMSEYELSLDNMITENSDNDYYEVIEDSKNNTELKVQIQSELEKLSSTERELIKCRYESSYTQSETARLLNMNQVQVSRLEKKTKEKLRSAIML